MSVGFETLRSDKIAAILPVSAGVEVMITRMREPVEAGQRPSDELLVGDVLRRTCRLGGEACAQVCQAPEDFENEDRECSDMNLKSALDVLVPKGIEPIMVAVTKDRVGFADELDEYEEEGLITRNSQGIREIGRPGVPGFNAFFATTDENLALGARLADCGYVGVEFKTYDGEKVIGFMHLSRPNMQGASSFEHEIDGEKVGVFEYFLTEALGHYGADKDSVKVRIAAAITKDNFPQTFKDKIDDDGKIIQTAEEVMRDRFKGWYEEGYLDNSSNPNWQPGEPINPDDVWSADYRDMVLWQVLRSGVNKSKVSFGESIDAGDLELGHASNHAGAFGKIPDARDLYLTVPRKSA